MLPAQKHPEHGAGLRHAMGVAMGVLIALAASVALVLGHTLLTAPGYGEEATLWVVFFGLVMACGLATPLALRLGRAPKGRAAGRPEVGRTEPRRSVDPGGPTLVPVVEGSDEKRAERELLETIRRHGRVTPVQAALETPLTVAEADRMLSDLAKGGHLEVLVEGHRLVYRL